MVHFNRRPIGPRHGSAFQSSIAHFAAQGAAIVVDQCIGDRLQISGDDLIEFVQREIDAMVGDPVLGKVVGANPLAAVPGADQRLSLVGPFLFFFLAFVDRRVAPSVRAGLGQILVLALFVLALDDDTRFVMRQSNGRFGLVDVLPARAAGVKLVDPVVVRLQIDVDIFRFGHHRDRGGRRVDASLGLGFGHALHAMSAAFVLQFAIDAFAFEGQRRSP